MDRSFRVRLANILVREALYFISESCCISIVKEYVLKSNSGGKTLCKTIIWNHILYCLNDEYDHIFSIQVSIQLEFKDVISQTI